MADKLEALYRCASSQGIACMGQSPPCQIVKYPYVRRDCWPEGGPPAAPAPAPQPPSASPAAPKQATPAKIPDPLAAWDSGAVYEELP